jgi:hypothetical protein
MGRVLWYSWRGGIFMALNMNATPESVWALFQETDRMQKETAREMEKTDKKFQETDKQFKETERLLKEQSAETDKKIQALGEKIDKLSKTVGGVTGSLGDIAEGLLASDLSGKFAAIGLKFDYTIQNLKVKDKTTELCIAEVDNLLVNGTIAMVVEAKLTMTRGDGRREDES